jgi:hypothetical protein
MFPNCGDVYSYFRFVISGFLVQVQAGKFFNRNLNTIIYNNGGMIMIQVFRALAVVSLVLALVFIIFISSGTDDD